MQTPIIATSKVMQNFTICLPKAIREKMQVKKGDSIIVSINEEGEVRMLKGVTTLSGLFGIGKKTFDSLGGAKKFIESERNNW